MSNKQDPIKDHESVGWRVRSQLGDFVILRRSDYERGGDIPAAVLFTESEFASWARDPMLRLSLLEIYEEVYGQKLIHPLRIGISWLVARIHDAFRRGELILTPAGWNLPPLAGLGIEQQEETTAPVPRKEVEKTWFRARLVDEDGGVMAGEDYILMDTTGARTEGKLDASGEVYIPSILPPGDCTIHFPNIHLNPRKRK